MGICFFTTNCSKTEKHSWMRAQRYTSISHQWKCQYLHKWKDKTTELSYEPESILICGSFAICWCVDANTITSILQFCVAVCVDRQKTSHVCVISICSVRTEESSLYSHLSQDTWKKRASEEIVSFLQIKSLQSLSAAAVYKHVELLLH